MYYPFLLHLYHGEEKMSLKLSILSNTAQTFLTAHFDILSDLLPFLITPVPWWMLSIQF